VVRLLNAISLAIVLLGVARPVASAEKGVKIPDVWRGIPDGVLDTGRGYAWYRCWFELPADWPVDSTELFLEAVDDAREAYIDGERVAAIGQFPPAYRSGLGDNEFFALPAGLLRRGSRHLLAIRVYYDRDCRTGFNVAPPALFGGSYGIRFQGDWQLLVGDQADWGAARGAGEPARDLIRTGTAPAADLRRSLKKLADEVGPLAPRDALARMQVPDDLELQLVLSEPQISQPLFMTFDARGRMWLVEYRQYPNPAGLKMVSRDKFLRTVYDKVPPAPPNHFPGDDRVTIHEDTDHDGIYDRHTTFVDRLSLATSVAVDHDGAWVLNPPYLLFYPDRDHDDRPDGDPEVHLEGFGIEDSHSIANSLRWGPDGWLYAAQGSTVSAEIRRPDDRRNVVHSMGQLIWRYHPRLRRYEIFAEGGGNTFGVEIDDKGRCFSGHNGGDTRGFHYVQGGYSQKGFGKHGPLSNPFAFGYFAPMSHHAVQRFTHNFVIYQADALPAQYAGRLFGVGPLQSHVVMSDFMPDRSTFKSKDVGLAISTADTWCRPVDIKVGPEGAIYVADLYEQRIDHASHYQGRVDKASGRVYRLQAKGARPVPATDWTKADSGQLIRALAERNPWVRQTAARQLAVRDDAALDQQLPPLLANSTQTGSLEALWALHGRGRLREDLLKLALAHTDAQVRVWAVRLACDEGEISADLLSQLRDLAYRDPNVEVRCQLACSARRLPAEQGLALVRPLAARDEDQNDPLIPLLLWWCLEANADRARPAVVDFWKEPQLWRLPIARQHLIARQLRRFAQAGSRGDLLTCAELLALAPDPDSARLAMAGFEEAFQGRSLREIPVELAQAIARAGGASLPLRVRQGEEQAIAEALAKLEDAATDAGLKVQLVDTLGQMQLPAARATLMRIATDKGNDTVRAAALSALLGYDGDDLAAAIIKALPAMSADTRLVAQSVLASRRPWSRQLLAAVDSGQLAKDSVGTPMLKKLLLHTDPEIESLVKKNFGDIQGTTTRKMLELVERYTQIIGTGSGNPYAGRQVYRASCGKCHILFEDGGRIGPDLTAYKRDDLKRMLLNVVNPSAEIREGFENYLVRTEDGKALTGFVTDQDSQVVVLKGIDGQSVVVPRTEIEEMRVQPTSLMPEELLKPFSDQQVRDLFAYLRATQPLP